MLVISDRTVIDSQLQEALFDFQRTSGVVVTITNKDGSKSAKLAEALSGDKKSSSARSRLSPSLSKPCANWPPPKASVSR